MKRAFFERAMVAYRILLNLKDKVLQAKVKREDYVEEGMRKCGKPRDQICRLVDEGYTF